MRGRERRQRGFVLVAVLFFILLMISGVTTFLRRATLDSGIAKNRDRAARSEALARGGVRLATALLLQDRLDEAAADFRSDSRNDIWARIGATEITLDDGGQLRLHIEDAGARLNLNALLGQNGAADPRAESFLDAFLQKVIEEMPAREEEKNYDPSELARNLIDYVDADDVAPNGEREDDYYQLQEPPYRAANRPLLSLDELGLVEGFDQALVEAIRPYATVYPLTGGGINPNTAPSHVLAAIFQGAPGHETLADEDAVRRLLVMREDTLFCDQSANVDVCTPVKDAGIETIFPPATYSSDIFDVRSEASYDGVRRTVEAVIDRSNPSEPLILSWRVR